MRTIPSAGVAPLQRRKRADAACSAALTSDSARPFVHEQHVEVAAVGDLGPAEAAHGDHRHRHARPDRVQCGRDDGGPEIGKGATGLAQAREGEEVSGRDADGFDFEEVAQRARPPAGPLGGGDHGLFDELARLRRGEGGRRRRGGSRSRGGGR